MIGRLFRILSGFILACYAAGLTKVLFAFPLSEVDTLPPDLDRFALAVPIATHAAIFSAPFALIAIWLGEWRAWRDWAYYAAAGMAIALVGFFAQYASETDNLGWSILNSNYPLMAFLTTGFAAGLVYWLSSGRLAGHHALSTAGHHAHGGYPSSNGSAGSHGAGRGSTTTTVSTKG